jgi:hypothetical protein
VKYPPKIQGRMYATTLEKQREQLKTDECFSTLQPHEKNSQPILIAQPITT